MVKDQGAEEDADRETKNMGSSLFSVGEDEIQRNNQEISKSGKERDECGLSTTEGIAVAHPWI